MIEKDALFFTKAEWNSLITFINNAYSAGSSSLSNNAKSGTGVTSNGTGGSSGLPASDPNDFMTAQMYNAVSSALRNLGGSTGDAITKTSVVKDIDIVYGSYFATLESYANGLKYKET